MKHFVLSALLIAQVGAVAVIAADEKEVGGVLVDGKGNVNLGGLLKVDSNGNVDIGVGGSRIKVDGGNVEIGATGAKIDVNGSNTDISAGGSSIKVDGGSTDIKAGGTGVDVNQSQSGAKASRGEKVKSYKTKQLPSNSNRKPITDGVFFDNEGKVRKLTSGDFNRIEIKDLDWPTGNHSGANFSRSIITNVNFSGSDFSGADFSRTVLTDVNFINETHSGDLPSQNLSGISFSNSKITNVNFSGSDLSGADFSSTTLENVDLSNTDLTGVDLSRTVLINVSFSKGFIVGSNFRRATFTNVDLSNAVAAGSCFKRNTFDNVKMVNVNLTDSVFHRYSFSNVDFSGTNKGVAIWDDSSACEGIEDYAKRANISALKSNSTEIQSKQNSTKVVAAPRKEFIAASAIIKKLAEGVGTKIDLTVNFRTDSDQLYGNAHAQVAEIAKALNSDSLNGVRVMIEGHTDSEGTDDYNLDLSYRRALTVQGTLVKDYGIGLDLLTIKGFGEDKPVASNDSATGRSLNRRVTLVRR